MPKRSPLPGVVFAFLVVTSCGRGDLPEVPEFDALGFADALVVIREQVFAVYEDWQEKPLDADRNGRLGMHLSIYQKSAAAEILYRRARLLASDEFRWTYYLAYTLKDLGRTEEAAAMFREALMIEPGHPETRIQLAQLLFQGDHLDDSRVLFEAISVEYPDRVEGWLGLGKIDHRRGDHDVAIAALERARMLGPQYGEVHYSLGLALRANGDTDAAVRELAIHERTADNKFRAADELLLDVAALHAGDAPHMAKGRYLRAHAQYEKAALAFRAALTANPANQDAWAELVACQADLGAMDAASASYREALVLGIDYAPLHLAYGQALMDQRQLHKARDAIGKAIDLDPQYADAYTAMGTLEKRSEANAEAVEQFRLALALLPNDRQVQMKLAQVLNATGQYEDAVNLLLSLVTEPALEKSVTLKELALGYYGMNRKKEAMDALQRGRAAARSSANIRMADEIDALLRMWQDHN